MKTIKYQILKTRQFYCFCLIAYIKDGSINTTYIFIKCKSSQRETIVFDTFAHFIYIQTHFFHLRVRMEIYMCWCIQYICIYTFIAFSCMRKYIKYKSTVGSEAKIILLSAIIKVKKYPVNFYIYFQVIASR